MTTHVAASTPGRCSFPSAVGHAVVEVVAEVAVTPPRRESRSSTAANVLATGLSATSLSAARIGIGRLAAVSTRTAASRRGPSGRSPATTMPSPAASGTWPKDGGVLHHVPLGAKVQVRPPPRSSIRRECHARPVAIDATAPACAAAGSSKPVGTLRSFGRPVEVLAVTPELVCALRVLPEAIKRGLARDAPLAGALGQLAELLAPVRPLAAAAEEEVGRDHADGIVQQGVPPIVADVPEAHLLTADPAQVLVMRVHPHGGAEDVVWHGEREAPDALAAASTAAAAALLARATAQAGSGS